MAEAIYVEEQRPPLWPIILLLAFTIYGVWIGFREDSWVAVVASAAVMLLILPARIQTEVQKNGVVAAWRPLKKRFVPWDQIGSVEPITYNPLRDYGGWGIKYSLKKKGWAYTMRGNKGVLLRLRDGKTLLLGSDHPEELAVAINGILTPKPADGA